MNTLVSLLESGKDRSTSDRAQQFQGPWAQPAVGQGRVALALAYEGYHCLPEHSRKGLEMPEMLWPQSTRDTTGQGTVGQLPSRAPVSRSMVWTGCPPPCTRVGSVTHAWQQVMSGSEVMGSLLVEAI